MFCKVRFLYEDAAAGTGGGGETTTTTETKSVAQVPEALITAEQLKEYGLDKDGLQNLLKQHKESKVPAEEKEKEDQLRKADFIRFSAENDLIKVEEISTYESLKAKPDHDLVFEKYLQEWKEENPDEKDADKIMSEAKIDFENEYKLTSQNEKQKARGEAKLAKEAAELRGPVATKYEKAQAEFKESLAVKGRIPEFNKAIESLIEKCTPDKLPISKVKDGEEELPIEVELTKADREELIKTFRNPKTFLAFSTEKDLSKFEATFTKKINGFLKEKYFDTIVGKSYETGKGRGLVKGSNVGAQQPFAIIKGNAPNSAANTSQTLEQSNDKIAAAKEQYRR